MIDKFLKSMVALVAIGSTETQANDQQLYEENSRGDNFTF
jgi:hypothetical protein